MIEDWYHDREQSQVKHKVLERYLQAFAPIIGSAFEEIVYIDCLAGPWKSRDEQLSDTSFHKALSVFRECKSRGRCKRIRALLIEKDPESFDLLEKYGSTVKDIEVETKQWDFSDHVSDVVRFATASRNSFAFFFIDPTGWSEIRLDRIRPILQVNPGEVLINFMSSWVKRFLGDASKPLEELLGPKIEHLRSLRGDELEDELVNAYAELIREVGSFKYSCAIPILMPDKNAIHYHLVFGTRSYKGLEVFKKTEEFAIPFMHELRANAQRRREEEQRGQRFLLAPSDTYSESRFRDFNSRRRANARAAVEKLIQVEKTISFRSIYQECMQFSTVTLKDLRDWLDEWRSNGSIRFANWSKNQRVPNEDTQIVLLKPLKQ
jgi:three-Cys-motif partner protein